MVYKVWFKVLQNGKINQAGTTKPTDATGGASFLANWEYDKNKPDDD